MELDIANLVLGKYEALKKQGCVPFKPVECTILAGVVQLTHVARATLDRDHSALDSKTVEHVEVICLATGSKCLGQSMLNTHGTVLHDSHAEVLCRRLLRQYLYQQVIATAQVDPSDTKASSILEFNRTSGTFHLKDTVSFHMYISQPPCGDAGIYDMTTAHEHNRNVNSRKGWEKSRSSSSNILDTGRTGAKPAPPNEGDTHAIDDASNQASSSMSVEALCDQSAGLLRIKAGRSDLPEHLRTRSMSCSDKIALWQFTGWQGSLLSFVLPEPITLSSVTIGSVFESDEPQFLLQALRRALESRFSTDDVSSITATRPPLLLRHTTIMFEHTKSHVTATLLQRDDCKHVSLPRVAVSGVSLNWLAGPTDGKLRHNVEVTVQAYGRKQGFAPIWKLNKKKKQKQKQKRTHAEMMTSHAVDNDNDNDNAKRAEGDDDALKQCAPNGEPGLKQASRLCKRRNLAMFQEVVIASQPHCVCQNTFMCAHCIMNAEQALTYAELKKKSQTYMQRKAMLKRGLFSRWVTTDQDGSLEAFRL